MKSRNQMKLRHSRYANKFYLISILAILLPLIVPVSTASAAAYHQNLPEPDGPTNPPTTEPSIVWNTFLGSKEYDNSNAIAVDGSGNVYLTGSSVATWGSPINAHAGGVDSDGNPNPDAFVAKLDSSGVLQWHTFLGSTAGNAGMAIAVDENGNVYLTGYSNSTWGRPINVHASGDNNQELPTRDAFVAKLNSNGVLEWNTFLGASTWDVGNAIAVDSTGNIYVTGVSKDARGPEMDAAGGCPDAFAIKLNNRGILQWTTFLGSSERCDIDFGNAIAVDGNGDIYITGSSSATWGNPINAHARQVRIDEVPQGDAFVAKLNSDGVLQWNTFLGSTAWDGGNAIAVDGSGNVYLAGYSDGTWGSPRNTNAEGAIAGNPTPDSFVAKLNRDGVLQWNTFFGSTEWDEGSGIAVDGSGNVYLTGFSVATWGSPHNAHAGGVGSAGNPNSDSFVAKLNRDGALQWNTFFGSTEWDAGSAIAVDGGGNVYLAGHSVATWGSPLNVHSGSEQGDIFVVKFADPENAVLGQATHTPDLSWISWGALIVLGVFVAIFIKYTKRLSKS